MSEELQGHYVKAKNIYKNIIKQNPQDGETYKRMACMFRDQGKLNDAIDVLNEYLRINMSDVEAWRLLAQIFSNPEHFQSGKALFCFEEVLTCVPQNYLFNLKYADCLYSTNDADNMVLARKFYSKVLTNKPDCVRAAWGLLETCWKLQTMGKKYDDDKNEQLIDLCKDTLKEIYKKTSTLDIDKLKC